MGWQARMGWADSDGREGDRGEERGGVELAVVRPFISLPSAVMG